MAAVDLVGGQPQRQTVDLEREGARPMGRPELVVGGRDLEVGRLVAGVRLERQALEHEVDVDRVVRQALERGAFSGGTGLLAESLKNASFSAR